MHFHTTRIYQRSLELAARSREAINGFPPGHAFLADQLRRASSSLLLNFAEGYGKPSRKEARRYFSIAQGSANEVAAAFDWAHTFGLVPKAQHTEAIDLADHIARMLTRFRR